MKKFYIKAIVEILPLSNIDVLTESTGVGVGLNAQEQDGWYVGGEF